MGHHEEKKEGMDLRKSKGIHGKVWTKGGARRENYVTILYF